jgi:hypothetical protein
MIALPTGQVGKKFDEYTSTTREKLLPDEPPAKKTSPCKGNAAAARP